MVEIVNALICKNCEAILKYEKSDIKSKIIPIPAKTYKNNKEVWTFDEDEVTFVTCPRCNNEVRIIW